MILITTHFFFYFFFYVSLSSIRHVFLCPIFVRIIEFYLPFFPNKPIILSVDTWHAPPTPFYFYFFLLPVSPFYISAPFTQLIFCHCLPSIFLVIFSCFFLSLSFFRLCFFNWKPYVFSLSHPPFYILLCLSFFIQRYIHLAFLVFSGQIFIKNPIFFSSSIFFIFLPQNFIFCLPSSILFYFLTVLI